MWLSISVDSTKNFENKNITSLIKTHAIKFSLTIDQRLAMQHIDR